jgi:hypothetical protein
VRGIFRYDAKSSTTYQHVWRKVVWFIKTHDSFHTKHGKINGIS